MSENKNSLSEQIDTPAQLLVEGRTPELFFHEMIGHLGLKDRIQVRNFHGISDLTPYLKTFTQLAAFVEKVTSLGIIRDAENKPASDGFASVCSSLKNAGIEPPDKMGEVVQRTSTAIGVANDGPVTQRTFKVGVFILPDCQSEGMLETVCLESVASEVDVLSCIENYFNCLAAKNAEVPKNITKAKTWAFLATKNLSDPQVGRAAQKKIWPWDNEAFDKLRNFLRSLA